MPIVTTQGEYRYVGRLTVTFDPAGHLIATDAAKSGPVRVTADTTQPDYVAEDAGPQGATITDPLVAYKANLAANKIGTTDVLPRRWQPEPDPPAARPTSVTWWPTASSPPPTAPRPPTGARWPTSRSPTAAASAPRSRPGNITEKSTFDVLPFDNVIVTVPERHAGALQGADGVGRRRAPDRPTAASRRSRASR